MGITTKLSTHTVHTTVDKLQLRQFGRYLRSLPESAQFRDHALRSEKPPCCGRLRRHPEFTHVHRCDPAPGPGARPVYGLKAHDMPEAVVTDDFKTTPLWWEAAPLAPSSASASAVEVPERADVAVIGAGVPARGYLGHMRA